jgi:hypothetical protein
MSTGSLWFRISLLPLAVVFGAAVSPALFAAADPADDHRADTAAVAVAILHINGAPDGGLVLVNGAASHDRIALFADDRIETGQSRAAVAALRGTGLEILLQPETIVQIEQGEVVLEHGSVRVTTRKGFRLRAGCTLVTPTDLAERTEYQVTDVDGNVKVAALVEDVRLDTQSSATKQKAVVQEAKVDTHNSGSVGGTIVSPGNTATRRECKAGAGKPADAVGERLSSPYVKWAVAGGIIAVTCYVLCESHAPVSPAVP